jgi:diacylglycerol kinase (ATP)
MVYVGQCRGMNKDKKFYLIVNPHGGRRKGHRLLKLIRPVLEAAGLELELIETKFAGHARELARQLDFDGYEGLIAIGGDGTMHEVVNGILTRPDQKKIPIGLIPGGSGNAFMYDLDLLDPLAAVQVIIGGHTRSIDAAEVNVDGRTIYAFNIIGWGLVTDVGRRAEHWRWLGEARYTIASIVEVFRPRTRAASLILDGAEIIDDFTFVLACNTRYTGKGMKAAPQARLDDGLIDVVVVRRGAGRLELLSMLPKIYDGSYIDSPLVESYPVTRFSLLPERDEALNIDGDISGATPVHVVMRPAAFEVFDRPG